MIDDKTFDELRKQLPFLPGHSFERKDIRPNERKSHAFDYSKQIPVYRASAAGIGIDLFDLGGSALPGQPKIELQSFNPVYKSVNEKCESESVPRFVALDRKVLRFYGYFQEGAKDTFRVRR
jgi:hypothetical protein